VPTKPRCTVSEGYWLNPGIVGRWSHFLAKPFLVQSRTNPNLNPNLNPNFSVNSFSLELRYFYDVLTLLASLFFSLIISDRPCRNLPTLRQEPFLHAGTPLHLLAPTLLAIRTSTRFTSPPDRSGHLSHSLLVTHSQT